MIQLPAAFQFQNPCCCFLYEAKKILIALQAVLTEKPVWGVWGLREEEWSVQQWSKSDMRRSIVELESSCFLLEGLVSSFDGLLVFCFFSHCLWGYKRLRRWYRDRCQQLHFETRKFNGAKNPVTVQRRNNSIQGFLEAWCYKARIYNPANLVSSIIYKSS